MANMLTNAEATIMNHVSKKLFDNMIHENLLLELLSKSGDIEKIYGGKQIEEVVALKPNTSIQSRKSKTLIDPKWDQSMANAIYNWSLYDGTIDIEGRDERNQEASELRKVNLLESLTTIAVNSMKNLVAQHLCKASTAAGEEDLQGLDVLISDTPATGVVGGIDRSVVSEWRNSTYNFFEKLQVPKGQKPTAAQLITALNATIRDTREKGGQISYFLMDANYWDIFAEYAASKQQLLQKDANVGFTNYTFGFIPVYPLAGCKENHCYAICKNALKFYVHPKAQFTVSDKPVYGLSDAKNYLIKLQACMSLRDSHLQTSIFTPPAV
jgi:hypothetical protein